MSRIGCRKTFNFIRIFVRILLLIYLRPNFATMKSNYLILTLVFILFSKIGISQEMDLKITKSDIIKLPFKDTYYNTFDGLNDGIVVIYRSKEADRKGVSKIYIKEYSSDLKLLNELEREIVGGDSFFSFKKDSTIGFFHRKINKKKNLYEFYVSTCKVGSYNFKTEKFFSIDAKQIDNKRFLNFLQDADGNGMGKMRFSKDLNYFVLSFDVRDKSTERHKYYVFDVNFNKIYEQDFLKDVKDRKYHLVNFVLSEENQNVYMLARNGNDINTWNYEINRISKEGVTNTVIDAGGMMVNELYLYQNDQEIYVLGYFYDKDNDNRDGIIYQKFDLDFNNLLKRFTLPNESFFSSKFNKPNKNKFGSFWNRGHHISKENGLFLFLENYDFNQVSENSPIRYTYKDMMLLKLGNDGAFEWGKNISKNQFANRTGRYHSFNSIHANNFTYYFFNSVRENNEDGELKFSGSNFRKQSFYVMRFDKDGNFDYKKLIDNEDLDLPIQIRNGSFIFGNSIYFRAFKDKEHQYIKIDL